MATLTLTPCGYCAATVQQGGQREGGYGKQQGGYGQRSRALASIVSKIETCVVSSEW